MIIRNMHGKILLEIEGANLYGADLRGANLYGADLPFFQIPQEGEMIVYKRVETMFGGDVVGQFKVPAHAKRTASLVGRKCRASGLIPLKFFNTSVSVVRSWWNPDFTYELGVEARPNEYDDNPAIECTYGLHFYLTREEAEEF